MNIREDIGPVVLDYLFRSLQIDAKWSLRESRGFTWWPYRLRQRVWVEPARLDADYAIVRVHAESSLLKDVPNSQSSLERVNALNASDASMSAYVFEPGEQRLVMHCAADFHQGNAQWLSALFSGAAAIQAADAHSTAERAAAALGARPDETGHPRGGMRKKPDGMLGVIDIFFAPEGRGPSAFGDVDFADVLAMEPAPWVLADAGQRGMTAQFPFPGCMPPTALLEVSAEQRHPRLGSGALFTLTLPASLGGVNTEGLANRLNCTEARDWMRSHYFGAWATDGSSLAFRSFIPSALRAAGLVRTLLSSMAHRARWANDFLASENGIPDKFQGRDALSYQRQVKEYGKAGQLFLDSITNQKKPRPPQER